MLEDITIKTFDDAVLEAFALADQFRRAHTAVLTDHQGCVRDMTIFAAAHHSADTALQWASCALLNDDAITKMIVISIVNEGVEAPIETDIAQFKLARRVFAERGCEVVDHLLCDGETLRSLAFTTGAPTWEQGDSRLRPS